MAVDLETRIKIIGEDLTGKAWAHAAASAKSFSNSMARMATRSGIPRVGRALADVGRAFTGVARAAAPFMRVMSQLTGLTLAGGLAALTLSIKRSAQAIDDMYRKSQLLGMTTQQLRVFTGIGRELGVSAESMASGLSKATGEFRRMQVGVGRTTAFLKKSNPWLLNQIRAAKSSTEAFNIMLSAIHAAKTEAAKMQLAQMFFGSEDFVHIANQSEETMKGMWKTWQGILGNISDDQAGAINSFNDAMDRLKGSFEGFSDMLTIKFLADPQMRQNVDALREWFQSVRPAIITALSDAFKSLVAWIKSIEWQNVGNQLKAFWQELKRVVSFIGGFKTILIALAAAPFLGIAASIASLTLSLGKLGVVLTSTPIGLAMLTLAGAGYVLYKSWDKLGPEVDKMGQSLKKLDGSFADSFKSFDKEFTKGVQQLLGGEATGQFKPLGYRAGEAFMDGIVAAITDMGNRVLSRLSGLGREMVGAVLPPWMRGSLGLTGGMPGGGGITNNGFPPGPGRTFYTTRRRPGGGPGGAGGIRRSRHHMSSLGGPAVYGGEAPKSGAPGQYRPIYPLSAADLDPRVINTIAGEAYMKKPGGVDAVVNNMFNRVGTKAYGPSANLLQVARAPKQYTGYSRAGPKEQAYIAGRIRAIAGGGVPDITKGSNEYRADWYRGAWQRKNFARGVNIGGNVFARNERVPAGPFAPYAKPRDPPLSTMAARGGGNVTLSGKGEVKVTVTPGKGLRVGSLTSSSEGHIKTKAGVDNTGQVGWRPEWHRGAT